MISSRHFRYGAPPVINPLGTSFPDNTLSQASFHIRALLSTMLLGNTSVNISHPAPGDWFVVAHLPPSSQKIEVKVRGLASWDEGQTP